MPRRSFKPLARTHFALAGQPEAQFPYFAQLCAWLIRELTPDFIEWNEFEDPTTICENISAEIRRLGFPGDVQTSDMKRGSGDGVCLIIDFLATKLMQHQSFRVSQPRYAAFTGDAEEAVVDDDGGGEQCECLFLCCCCCVQPFLHCSSKCTHYPCLTSIICVSYLVNMI
jgi:hypothetical protein